MKARLIAKLIEVILMALTPELLRRFADFVLDFVEDKVLGSASTVDDRLVLPLCIMIREAFNIPDDDAPFLIEERFGDRSSGDDEPDVT